MPLTIRSAIASIAAAILILASPANASHSRGSSHYSSGHSRSTHDRAHSYGSHPHRTYSRSAYHAPRHSHAAAHHTYVHRHYSGHTKRYAYGVPRDKNGRIKRSSSAKHEFERETGYPHGRPGYVIDHIVPLSKGGKDDPSNMQWQTVEEAKAKDKVERK